MAPWILAILYDFLFYVCRQIWHEIPVVGGRARGAQRPRAPSLRDRPRRMSFRDLLTGEGPNERRPAGLAEKRGHRRDLSRESIEEVEEDDGHGR
jgi:hypothetical protein